MDVASAMVQLGQQECQQERTRGMSYSSLVRAQAAKKTKIAAESKGSIWNLLASIIWNASHASRRLAAGLVEPPVVANVPDPLPERPLFFWQWAEAKAQALATSNVSFPFFSTYCTYRTGSIFLTYQQTATRNKRKKPIDGPSPTQTSGCFLQWRAC